MDVVAIGGRLREARKRRGLTQRELARLAGVSVSLIRKLEQGDYDNGLRLETVRKLAVALSVPTSALAVGGSPPPPDQESVTRWEPVRQALEGAAGGEPDWEPTLAGVRMAAGEAIRLFRDNSLTDLAGLLPPLLADADALVASNTNGVQVTARAERSRIRVVAGSLLVHTWQFPAAERAFTLAMEDADGPLAQVTVIGQRCFALSRQGLLAECRELAVRGAGEAEPRLSAATREELAAWGGLLLWGAGASARDNRPDDADAMIRLARAAAAAAGGDFVPPHAPWHRFGPSVVAVAEAESAVIQDRPDRALAIGRRLSPMAHQYPRHRLDVAAAHASLRQYPEAVEVLRDLRRTRPQWLPQQRYAARILSDVIGRRRSLTAEMRDLADYLRLPL
ncbi:MAG TPA: helix-turn-helix domain-containing protein [Streptosporangiaceae bacterium]|nr:helix-turn-helix domain-containing protein [Streptosporangiaceae bacterium]